MSVRDVCGIKHLLNLLEIFNTLKLDIGNHSVIYVCINRLINCGRIEDDNFQKSTLSTLMIFSLLSVNWLLLLAVTASV